MKFLQLPPPCRVYKSEYRKKFRPFSQYQYVDGKFHKVKGDEPSTAAGGDSANNWYKEVIELRRQAGQYRVRWLSESHNIVILLLHYHFFSVLIKKTQRGTILLFCSLYVWEYVYGSVILKGEFRQYCILELQGEFWMKSSVNYQINLS